MSRYPGDVSGRLDRQAEELLDALARSPAAPVSERTLAQARARRSP